MAIAHPRVAARPALFSSLLLAFWWAGALTSGAKIHDLHGLSIRFSTFLKVKLDRG